MLRLLLTTHRIRRKTRLVGEIASSASIVLGLCVLTVAHASFYCPFGVCGGINAGVNIAAGYIPGVATNTPANTITNIISIVLSYTGLLAVAVIIIAGLYLILGLGNDSSKETAKKIILYTGIGIVIIGLAQSIVTFFQSLPTGIDSSNLWVKILTMLQIVLSFVGLLAVAAIIIGGLMFILSAGDEGRKDTGKKTIIYAIVGLIIIGVASAMVRFVVGLIS